MTESSKTLRILFIWVRVILLALCLLVTLLSLFRNTVEAETTYCVTTDERLVLNGDNANCSQVKPTNDPRSWIQVNQSGFGNPQNTNIGFLEVFNDNLYAGTWRPAANQEAEIWRSSDGNSWEQLRFSWVLTPNAMLDAQPFGNYLYVGTASTAPSGFSVAELWRTNGVTWTQVVSNGFGSFYNNSISALSVFSDSIYAATTNVISGTQIWRSPTGVAGTWSKVVPSSFGRNGTTQQDVTMDVFGGSLFVGVGRVGGAAELWKTSNGISWSSVFTDGLGTANNTHVASFAAYDGDFYLGLRNVTTGGEIWKSSDGISFTPVITGGFGNLSNSRPYGLMVYEQHLYAVVGNQNTGAEVWRMADGASWEKVADRGLGDAQNQIAAYFDKALALFDGGLFVGTLNGVTGGQVRRTGPYLVFLPSIIKDASSNQ